MHGDYIEAGIRKWYFFRLRDPKINVGDRNLVQYFLGNIYPGQPMETTVGNAEDESRSATDIQKCIVVGILCELFNNFPHPCTVIIVQERLLS
jgi:hypothetical protein